LLFLTAITPVPFAWLTVVITILIIPSPVLCSNGDLECIHRWVDVLSQTVHDQWCAASLVDPEFPWSTVLYLRSNVVLLYRYRMFLKYGRV
jgi:hypothetical protein